MFGSKRRLCAALSAALVLGACATGPSGPRDDAAVREEVARQDDAVAQPSGAEIVLPEKQTRAFFDVAQRQPAGNLTGKSLADPAKIVSLRDYRGKVLVLNVWSSWCPPCRDEVDDFMRVQQSGADVQVLGIDVKDAAKPAREFTDEHGVTYPSLFDPSGQVALAVRGVPFAAIPVTVVLDREQKVAAVFVEPVADTDVLPVVRRVLADG
ncbi:MAG: TlpA family protein disulfide reductase [Saccharothrix sp.]|nr:TlpA family protein disulfide reductase [Saccharothrix sp.]